MSRMVRALLLAPFELVALVVLAARVALAGPIVRVRAALLPLARPLVRLLLAVELPLTMLGDALHFVEP